jgi:hypothetical protein
MKFENYEIRLYLMISCEGRGKNLNEFWTCCYVWCLQIETYPVKFHRVKKYMVMFGVKMAVDLEFTNQNKYLSLSGISLTTWFVLHVVVAGVGGAAGSGGGGRAGGAGGGNGGVVAPRGGGLVPVLS